MKRMQILLCNSKQHDEELRSNQGSDQPGSDLSYNQNSDLQNNQSTIPNLQK